MAKTLGVPLDTKIEYIEDVPYTISFVARKRIQLDNLNEIPKDKRPTEKIIWDGSPEEMEDWLDSVVFGKTQATIEISDAEIEG
jgi:hypothetical protein